MFFVQELFTHHQRSLGIVWLAAHWDPRKLTRARIANTAIPRTVEEITGSADKLFSLRTSGTLMLGVARIYSRKAQFLLEDCSNAVFRMHTAFRATPTVDMAESAAPASAITLPDMAADASLLGLDLYDVSLPSMTPIDMGRAWRQHTSAAHDITIQDVDFSLRRASQGMMLPDDDGFGAAHPDEMADLTGAGSASATVTPMDIGRRAAPIDTSLPPLPTFDADPLNMSAASTAGGMRLEDMPLEEGGLGGSHDFDGDPLIMNKEGEAVRFDSPALTGAFASPGGALFSPSIRPSAADTPSAAAVTAAAASPARRRRVAQVDASRQLSRASMKRQLEDASDITRRRPVPFDDAALAAYATTVRSAAQLLTATEWPLFSAVVRAAVEKVVAPPPPPPSSSSRRRPADDELEVDGAPSTPPVRQRRRIDDGEQTGDAAGAAAASPAFRPEDMMQEELGLGGDHDGYMYDPLIETPTAASASSARNTGGGWESPKHVDGGAEWLDEAVARGGSDGAVFQRAAEGRRRGHVAVAFGALLVKLAAGGATAAQAELWGDITVCAAA